MNGPSRFRGSYTDGETASLHEVEVRLAAYQISIHRVPDGTLVATWPVATLHVDRSMPPLVRITSKIGGDAALQVNDLGFKHAFDLMTTGQRTTEVSRNARVALALAVVIAIGAGIWSSLTPFSSFIAHRIPFAWEQKLGGQFRAAFAKDSCQDDELKPVLKRLKDSVQKDTKLPLDFEIVVAKDPVVNAFALPGGVVILNQGLISKAESSDEVAGVLAHEFQHVIRRHIMAKIVRGAILTAIWSFTVGDFSGVIVVDPHTIYQIASLKFDRDAESEADRGAVAMLDRAHISRQGFIDFFERLKKEGPNVPDILSTHPANADRIELLQRIKGPKETRPALSAADWDVLKHACRAGDAGTGTSTETDASDDADPDD